MGMSTEKVTAEEMSRKEDRAASGPLQGAKNGVHRTTGCPGFGSEFCYSLLGL